MPSQPSSARPDHIEQLRAEIRGETYRPARKIQPEAPPPPDPESLRHLFHVATGSRWMELGSREPKPRKLFGEFWYEGEFCILFADTNAGKSVLAVQLADSISRGRPVAPFALQAKPAKVLYVDFELSTRQFYQRYTGTNGDYKFKDNFIRAQFLPGAHLQIGLDSSDDHIIDAIEHRIRQLHITVLVIDNITCLRAGTENAAVALALMKNLKILQTHLNLSVLVLAHTPKRRNPAQPLSANDLHGSKLLINLADSAFAIGKSNTHAHLRYLKQIKQRSSRQLYGEGNVCLCRLQKLGSFLCFQFDGYSPERPHLRSRSNINRELLARQVTELASSCISQRQISQQLGISVGTVNSLLRRG